MNNLNSILLEGVISGKPYVVKEGKTERCSFVVSSLHYQRKGRDFEGQETRIRVMLRGNGLVAAVTKPAHDGRRVRVVGRIARGGEDNDIYIEAEHVEYRPELTEE
jgi:hypothetical protein